MQSIDNILTDLCSHIDDREHRAAISFKDFLTVSERKPLVVFRDIFQMFFDYIHSYVGDGIDEYPDDPESINYVYYDCSKLLVEDTDQPFFADRLFANRFVNLVSSFRHGTQQNRIYIIEGPHGFGKSTFLNNLLQKFEQYTKTDEGSTYETVWRLDKEVLGAVSEQEAHALLAQLKSLMNDSVFNGNGTPKDNLVGLSNKQYLEVPCPSHDHPLLLIPKDYRKDFFDKIIKDEAFKHHLFNDTQYEWVFKKNPCTICTSLYQALVYLLDSPLKVFDMIFARRYHFNRRLGEGISVYNPGDKNTKLNVQTNQLLQAQLNNLLKDSNRVKYHFSRYAKTNNGIYALMDIKANKTERFADLHGIISEGVHKVEDIEENVNSLFLALMNPEDQENIEEMQSFSDRITYLKIPYVLDYNTEVKIYKNVFGNQIESHFLPCVLQNFAKVIISSRLKLQSKGLTDWIFDPDKYSLYCDSKLHLLKMDIYTGLIPPWLKEEDRKRFTAKRRQAIISDSEFEGGKGFSGRHSIKIFNEFYATYAKNGQAINMSMVYNFFKNRRKDLLNYVPDGFLDSLMRFYNYKVLQEVKESLYSYNEDRISRNILNYIFGVNFEPGISKKCVYTGETLDITEDFFENIERQILGSDKSEVARRSFREGIQKLYASKTLTQEMMVEGKSIRETEVYQMLFERYVYQLKERALDPFLENGNFRGAIKDYATESFRTYEKRIREEVTFLIDNLIRKYGYTDLGAKEVCMYVVDNNIAAEFPEAMAA